MTDRAASGLKVHELSRQFGPSPQKIPPKVLSLVAKVTKPTDEADPTLMTDDDIDIDRPTGSLSDSPVHQTDSDSDDASSTTEMGPQLRTLPLPKTVASANYIIGLDQLQEQVRRLALRRGFTLNLMVVGRSGLGKSTLINTLFRSSVLPRNGSTGAPAKTMEIRTTRSTIQENGVKLNLTVTDTPGFGDRIDNSNCWEPALQYISDQYDKYLCEEQSAERSRWIHDTRVHCCLYFIPPTGHGLRALDLEVLKRLHSVVNVIPVIAKADTLTIEEREEFKRNIQHDLMSNHIDSYPLARYEHQEDTPMNQSYRNMTPFAVVGSEQVHTYKGRQVLGRQNGWGLVQVEEPNHCEFHHLRNLLIRNRMQDLIELTSAIHYEAYRRQRLHDTNSAMIDISSLTSLNESHI